VDKLVRRLDTLRVISSPVKSRNEGGRIARTLFSFLDKHNRSGRGPVGIGLSAIQLGIPKRVFVTLVGERPKAFINPQILKESEQQYPSTEWCLSLPGVVRTVARPLWVNLLTESREEVIGWYSPEVVTPEALLMASVVSHEYGHCLGVTILDLPEYKGDGFVPVPDGTTFEGFTCT
jgi:peptide deformylase